MKKIVLRVFKEEKPSAECVGMVRISPRAETILREWHKATGLPLSEIASQIIIQAADEVEIVEV